MEQIKLNLKIGLELIKEMDKLIERWQTIDGYDNYSVSTFGNVRNNKTDKILKNLTNGDGYLFVNLYKNGIRKTKKTHRLVCQAFLTNPENKKCVDHIDNERKNNHISNLRFATYSENNRNASMKKTNTSGFIGVSFEKSKHKWRAKYTLNKKNKHIGYYNTALEASIAYQAKIKEHYGEFAYA